ncbi:MAG: hypothetical protein K2O05_01440, partial [Anaeroplasmataceae bacterium]|nr:hypothetical protein [Anaeroplasmataceae bacterium]
MSQLSCICNFNCSKCFWNKCTNRLSCIIVLYCTLGGFLAVSTTDLIQGITMSIALIIVICFGVSQAGGVSNIMENA